MNASTPTRPAAPHFLLNGEAAPRAVAPGRLLLDALRKDQRLVGTKEGCREGDCGACAVLLGELEPMGEVTWRSVPSCMLLGGHVDGRQVVTIEGLNLPRELTPQQAAVVECGGSQCGFCTPGFIVGFTSFLLNAPELSVDEAVRAIGGNLCRCTGYVSLVRAAEQLVERFRDLPPPGAARVRMLVEAEALPSHFASARERLEALDRPSLPGEVPGEAPGGPNMGGGTDVIVQQGARLDDAAPIFLLPPRDQRQPHFEGQTLVIQATATFEDLATSAAFAELWPHARVDLDLFASAPIRERATVGGNLANASPIADGTAMLLALDATLELRGPAGSRRLALADYYLGYKQLDQAPGEHIAEVRVERRAGRRVHFEKLSKRTHLDIATVNSALGIVESGGVIEALTISAGGVAPTPLVLVQTADFLRGKALTAELLLEALGVLGGELSPIDDVRGSASYKALALGQLFLAHFLALFPAQLDEGALLAARR